MISKESKHLGRKISRIREIFQIKQEALAAELGVSQQAVSKLEKSDKIDDKLLERIARILNVSVDGIKNYTDEAIYNCINTAGENPAHVQSQPIEKIIELYERLLASEKEKVALLKEHRN